MNAHFHAIFILKENTGYNVLERKTCTCIRSYKLLVISFLDSFDDKIRQGMLLNLNRFVRGSHPGGS
jgi:hypothetical protein